jgi:hypothetical protein
MKTILERIAEGIGILLITFLYWRQRKIDKAMSVDQDKEE